MSISDEELTRWRERFKRTSRHPIVRLVDAYREQALQLAAVREACLEVDAQGLANCRLCGDETYTYWAHGIEAEIHSDNCILASPAPEAVARSASPAASRASMRSLLGLDNTYDLYSAVCLLVSASAHLLGAHSCDNHGYETLRDANEAGVRFLRGYEALVAPERAKEGA